MQLRELSAFALYLGSYLPLGLILLAQDVNTNELSACAFAFWSHKHCCLFKILEHPIVSLGVVAVCTICLLLTLLTLRLLATNERITIAESKHIPADLINYVIPYVVSFMALDYQSPTKLIGFIVFFVWIFWITYKSGHIIMNPLLIVFGWRLYEIRFSYLQGEKVFNGKVLSNIEIEPNSVHFQTSLQDVMIVKKQN